jgi:hypothetical protein
MSLKTQGNFAQPVIYGDNSKNLEYIAVLRYNAI